jgi:hypothetical protein
MSLRATLGTSLVLLILLGAAPRAQLGYIWSFEELTAKAQAIVIAEYVGTEDTGRERDHPELDPGFPVVELRSQFRVLSVLKQAGQPSGAPAPAGAELWLTHYRHDMDRWRRENPAQPGKPPPGVVNTGDVLRFKDPGPYLMFLVKGGGEATFEPLTGQTWPGDSVFPIRSLRQGARLPR